MQNMLDDTQTLHCINCGTDKIQAYRGAWFDQEGPGDWKFSPEDSQGTTLYYYCLKCQEVTNAR